MYLLIGLFCALFMMNCASESEVPSPKAGPQVDAPDRNVPPKPKAPPEPNVPPQANTLPTKPKAGSKPSDYGFTINGAKKYYLKSNELVKGFDKVSLRIKSRRKTSDTVRVFIDDKFSAEYKKTRAEFKVELDLAAMKPGHYKILLAESNAKEAFAELGFTLTHPIYLFVSNDWDYGDSAKDRGIQIRENDLYRFHRELKNTHFVGPYTFTDSTVSEARRRELVQWLLEKKRVSGDEIGLHIHPYCSFVTAARVNCKTSPSLHSRDPLSPVMAGQTHDLTGYSVVLSEYGYDDMTLMLDKADELFMSYGLPKPTSFRAGGWTARLHTLKALADKGYLVDGSAVNWKWISKTRYLYGWNKDNWNRINEKSQPYFPSINNIHSKQAPHLSIMEVPNNGNLVDYIDSKGMVDGFVRNWKEGELLTKPRVFSVGYHPNSFSSYNAGELHAFLNYADRFLASGGNGPVIYVTASEIPKGFR